MTLQRTKDHLCLRDHVLYRKCNDDGDVIYQLVLPVKHRRIALQGRHDDVGHVGRERTLSLMRERFFWLRISRDVTDYVAQCGRCLRRKGPTEQRAPFVSIITTQPLEMVCVDFLSLEQSKGGVENILVVTNHFSRYANQTARMTAKLLYNNFVIHYGFPPCTSTQ